MQVKTILRKLRKRFLALVFDTSPLIVLLDELKLDNYLIQLSQKVDLIVPNKVLLEYGGELPDYFTIVKNKCNFDILDYPGLGPGEISVICLVKELVRQQSYEHVIAVSDDKKARNTCERLQIECTGTLGIVELLKISKIISKEQAIQFISNIFSNSSLYLSNSVKRKVINQIRNQ